MNDDLIPVLQSAGHLWDSLANFMATSSTLQCSDVPNFLKMLNEIIPFETNASTVAYLNWFGSLDSALPLPGRSTLQLDSTGFTSHRYTQVLMDLKYTLQIPHPTLLHTFYAEFRLLCHILSLVQGCGADSRLQTDQNHVPYENRNWIVCIELSSMLNELFAAVMSNILQHHTTPAPIDSLPLILQAWFDAYTFWLVCTNKYFSPGKAQDNTYILPAWGAKGVNMSAHYPLHRALLLLFRACSTDLNLLSNFFKNLQWHDSLGEWHRHMLVLPLLEGLVWDAQVHSGMWKRNGWSVVNHSMNYGEPYYCMKFRNVDLLGIQLAASVLDIETLVALIFERFNISDLDHDGETMKQSMFSECLLVLCQVATEIPFADLNHPIHPLYPTLRQLILLRLCVKSSTHSELFKCVNEFISTYDVLCAKYPLPIDSTLKRIQEDICLPEQKMYTLRPEFYEEYNATSIHLTRKQHEVARVNRLQARALRWKTQKLGPEAAASIPLHAKFYDHSSSPNSFTSSWYLVLDRRVMQVLAAFVENIEFLSSTLTTMCIHLFTLQLYALRSAPEQVKSQYLQYMVNHKKVLDILRQRAANMLTWIGDSRDTSDANSEQCRHILWLIIELETYPGLKPQQEALSLTTGQVQPPSANERKRTAQQLALQKIQQQQAAFSQFAFEDGMGFDDDEDDECAMCHETSQPLSLIGFVQVSGVNVAASTTFKTPWDEMKRDITPLTVACCGHVVHLSCWQAYYATQFQKVITGEAYLNAVDVKKGEFLCPVCKTIANVLVPTLLPPSNAPKSPAASQTNWNEWLYSRQPILGQFQQPAEDVCNSISLMCMSIHRVATGSVEKSRPDRYMASACHAIASTIWHSRPHTALLHAAHNFRCIAPERADEAFKNDLQLLITGSEQDGVETTDTQTPTQVQKTWKGVVGNKPLLLQDLSSVLARCVLLAPTTLDQIRIVQLVTVAYSVQAFLWQYYDYQKNPKPWAIDSNCQEFQNSLFSRPNNIIASLNRILGVVLTAQNIACATEDIKRFYRVGLDLLPNPAPSVPILQLDNLPSEIVQLIPNWISAMHTTYETMTDPNKVLAQWQRKNASSVSDWSSVWQQDLTTAHVPLSPSFWRNCRSTFLTQLPHSYSELYMHLTKQKCPTCHQFPSRPALCLMCGLVMCAASTCREATVASMASASGACTLHAHKCGRGLGLFLLTVEGTVLLVSGKLAAYDSNGLYVDEYGEGFGERQSRFQFRGRPLFLDTTMQDRLIRLWKTQAIHPEIVHIQNTVDLRDSGGTALWGFPVYYSPEKDYADQQRKRQVVLLQAKLEEERERKLAAEELHAEEKRCAHRLDHTKYLYYAHRYGALPAMLYCCRVYEIYTNMTAKTLQLWCRERMIILKNHARFYVVRQFVAVIFKEGMNKRIAVTAQIDHANHLLRRILFRGQMQTFEAWKYLYEQNRRVKFRFQRCMDNTLHERFDKWKEYVQTRILVRTGKLCQASVKIFRRCLYNRFHQWCSYTRKSKDIRHRFNAACGRRQLECFEKWYRFVRFIQESSSSIIRIQAWIRQCICRKKYLKQKTKAILIQALWRGYSARCRVYKLREMMKHLEQKLRFERRKAMAQQHDAFNSQLRQAIIFEKDRSTLEMNAMKQEAIRAQEEVKKALGKILSNEYRVQLRDKIISLKKTYGMDSKRATIKATEEVIDQAVKIAEVKAQELFRTQNPPAAFCTKCYLGLPTASCPHECSQNTQEAQELRYTRYESYTREQIHLQTLELAQLDRQFIPYSVLYKYQGDGALQY
ncbi:hypothetical protein THRCLA_07427 [Thraustotheca clavata]|uniref:E3 ubiquitin-protein ligase n=1 Tax=Thraustotheca clavata TaxID=74557 RepID=A0A1V9ZDA7_9STRA|nr:hypothetical protein THRCLA_07427 [Thraustotheca clavata]